MKSRLEKFIEKYNNVFFMFIAIVMSLFIELFRQIKKRFLGITKFIKEKIFGTVKDVFTNYFIKGIKKFTGSVKIFVGKVKSTVDKQKGSFNKVKGFVKKAQVFVRKHYFVPVICISLLLNFIIELLSRFSLTGTLGYIIEHPLFFLYNSILIFFTFLLISLTGKRVFSTILASSLWVSAGITNSVLMHFRKTPFIAADFFVVKSALDIMDVYMSKFLIFLIGLAIIGVLVLLVYLFVKEKFKKTDYKKIALILVIIFVIAIIPANRIVLNKSDSESSNITDEANRYGFVCCFLNSIFTSGINKPDEYTHDSIKAMLNKIEPKKKANNDEKPNIVLIQLESFIDPNTIVGATYSSDPISNFRSLREKYSAGKLDVAVFGGGTANTEFEILTGMNVRYFGMGEYPYETILKNNTVESICYSLKEYGYKTHALHNHTGTFYDRHIVYKNLGFDTFTPSEYMNGIQYNKLGWEKSGVFTELMLDEMSKTPEKDFMFVVTAQCHGKYPDNFENKDSKIKVSGPETVMQIKPQLEYFVNELYDEDMWLGYVLERLQEFEEPVMAVIYGDHMPALNMTEEMTQNNNMYQTEYIIWTNYEQEKKDKDLSTYTLMPYAFSRIGIDNGIMTRLHQLEINKKRTYDVEQKQLQYDMIYGEKYAYDILGVSYKPTDMKLGVYDIVITDVVNESKTTKVKGKNFTKASVVFVDNNAVETKFVDSQTLEIKNSDAKGFKEIVVSQRAVNGVVLGSTAPFKKADN